MSELQRQAARRKILEISKGVLAGSVHPIEGCRALISLRNQAAMENEPAFDTIVTIESETDDFPVGSVRGAYDEHLLTRLDAEVQQYLEAVRSVLFDACKTLASKVETEEKLVDT
jgi:hypothetical protein